MVSSYWADFIAKNWMAMPPSRPIPVPNWLPHPSVAGFDFEVIAEAVGQVSDWVKSYADGSRIHVHECADGRLLVHRDRWDPRRGPGHFLLHVALETKVGPLVLGGLALAVIVKAASSR